MKCGHVCIGDHLHVDHIRAKSKHPKLKYALHNLQILCWKCNSAKGTNYADYRTEEQKLRFPDQSRRIDTRSEEEKREAAEKREEARRTKKKEKRLLKKSVVHEKNLHVQFLEVIQRTKTTKKPDHLEKFRNKYGETELMECVSRLPREERGMIIKLLEKTDM